jgi:hypothetical protein
MDGNLGFVGGGMGGQGLRWDPPWSGRGRGGPGRFKRISAEIRGGFSLKSVPGFSRIFSRAYCIRSPLERI